MRLQDLQAHLLHDLVVGLLQNPMSKTVLTGCLPRYEIDVRDRHVRMRIAAVGVQMYDDITWRVRCDFLRQRIGSVNDDLRRCRIVRVELVSGEALNDHQGLVLSTSALQHRLDGSNRVVRVTEVRTPRNRTRLREVRRLAVMRVDDRRCCSHRRRLLGDAHDDKSFAATRSVAVARRRASMSGSTPDHP